MFSKFFFLHSAHNKWTKYCITCSAIYPSFVWNLPAHVCVEYFFCWHILTIFPYVSEINECGLLHIIWNKSYVTKRIQNRFWRVEKCGMLPNQAFCSFSVCFVRVCCFCSDRLMSDKEKISSVYIHMCVCECLCLCVKMCAAQNADLSFSPTFLIVWLCLASATRQRKLKEITSHIQNPEHFTITRFIISSS